jgi:proteic killer suppression protein
MIRSFKDKSTEALFRRQTVKTVPADILERAYRVLSRIDAAIRIEDLKVPPSHRLHALKGDRAGRWSISVNMKYRVTFRFENGDAHEVALEDYH